jgi:hypothetical protein
VNYIILLPCQAGELHFTCCSQTTTKDDDIKDHPSDCSLTTRLISAIEVDFRLFNTRPAREEEKAATSLKAVRWSQLSSRAFLRHFSAVDGHEGGARDVALARAVCIQGVL